MENLVSTGLLYGGLRYINEAHLIERYNNALINLNIQPTQLTEFHIDATGYSPEIAEELNDTSYLDPRDVNRMYIILSTVQRNLPIIKTSFSADLTVFRRFMDANSKAIETLTLHDAIYGEMENFVWEVNEPSDVTGFKEIHFTVNTSIKLLEKAVQLNEFIQTFNVEENSWRDFDLMNNVVNLASDCGDIRNNGIVPKETVFDWPDVYHTTHFGGLYIIRYKGTIFLIGNKDKILPAPKNSMIVEKNDTDSIFHILNNSKMLEDINPKWLIENEILDHKISMLAAFILCENNIPFKPEVFFDISKASIFINKYHNILNKNLMFFQLSKLRTALAGNYYLNDVKNTMNFDTKLAVTRSYPDINDSWEINRLLAEYSAFDPVSTFIVNKPLFYKIYNESNEQWQQFAIQAVTTMYQPTSGDIVKNKKVMRQKFFGKY